ncbi:MAG: hypothetical protein KJ939_05080 [Nanoarchaeota archaeon]|nr:hypothetical protein [Nanoarchaeota archaeon]MBU4352424.1 hypothetical protein [Nanoarchaeota archaeon]MCG2720365.1 hypothetical protein [Nanoarchaeota archaeon]
MIFAIIVSKKDKAGMTIKDALLELYDFNDYKTYWQHENIKLYEVEQESIHCEDIDKIIIADYFIFATKHKSEAGKNSLSVHVPGNWGKAELGGKDKTLCLAPASLLKEMFLELNEQGKDLDYEITLETVHHGPCVEKPVMFIEIGSSEGQWKDKKAGNVISRTIMNVLSREIKTYKTVIGLGSSHYPQPFNKLLLRTEYAIGQICPKYQMDNLNEEMLLQAVKKNVEKIEFVLLDWKGLSNYKEKVMGLLDKLGLKYKKVKEII